MNKGNFRVINEGILLIGTSHIAPLSLEYVKEGFSAFNPDIVCLEIDRSRLSSLMSEKRGVNPLAVFRVGVGGMLFALLGNLASRILGKRTGVMPGDEMKRAFEEAVKRGKRVVLIDRDINITLKRFSKRISLGEKLRLIMDMVRGAFKPSRIPNLKGIDLARVPEAEVVDALIAYIKKRYRGIYNVLIGERDRFMASRIADLAGENPDLRIMAVMGAGHLNGVERILRAKLLNAKN